MLRRILSVPKKVVKDRSVAARRCIAVSAIVAMLAIFLGCMSLNIGWPAPETVDQEVLVQKGTLHASGETEQDVFYPIPYASPPNLTLDDTFWHDLVIVDQQPDHFRVRYGRDKSQVSFFGVAWTAKGIRATATKAPGSGEAVGQ
jgi:hypothetical protein